jgi:hypothetical protein
MQKNQGEAGSKQSWLTLPNYTALYVRRALLHNSNIMSDTLVLKLNIFNYIIIIHFTFEFETFLPHSLKQYRIIMQIIMYFFQETKYC